ncbi:hypothetical protein [Stenotrophomonas maltophilia]|uniref:hypothetical protein n=1 Tax=Stenotrophomonas maltophilia TaxID=40324 RepID=UPI000F4F7580|nr:hypothetical protein [Stenotrophomonas maltophilia]
MFYKGVSELASEATERLTAYLNNREDTDSSEVFKLIRDTGYAFLDGDNLKDFIQEDIGFRHERELRNAAIQALSFNSITRTPAQQNAPILNALSKLQAHALRLAGELENQESPEAEERGSSANRPDPFVAESHIEALRRLVDPEFDPRRLIRLLEEINHSFGNGCLMATTMLIRATADHIPPVFGVDTFAQVSNASTDAPRSFKSSMANLQNSLRKIADGHLHLHIRKRESIPEKQQVVGFQADVDVLVGEIVRRLSSP